MAWTYISNAMSGYKNETVNSWFSNYFRTIGDAVKGCGEGVISGLEFDFEGHSSVDPGWFSDDEAHYFSVLMDTIQKAMGDDYTVSADVGVQGIDGSPFGGSYPFMTKWVDPKIFQ